MGKTAKWIKDNLTPLIVSGVFFAGLYYAVTTSWRNEEKLSTQAEQLGKIRGDLAEIKRSLISVLLDEDPNKSEIIKGLVSDYQTLQGIERFNAGNFDGAFAVWVSSAQRGSKESVAAIGAATAALKAQVSDISLPPEQRQKAQSALSKAPRVGENAELIYVPHDK